MKSIILISRSFSLLAQEERENLIFDHGQVFSTSKQISLSLSTFSACQERFGGKDHQQ